MVNSLSFPFINLSLCLQVCFVAWFPGFESPPMGQVPSNLVHVGNNPFGSPSKFSSNTEKLGSVDGKLHGWTSVASSRLQVSFPVYLSYYDVFENARGGH